MRVCYFGFYSQDYPRNAALRRGLKAAGVDVVEVRVPSDLAPGHSTGHGIQGLGLHRLRHEAAELWRAAQRTFYLCRRFMRLVGRIDVIIVAEFNQGAVAMAAALARLRRVPLIVDFLISLYDEAVNHRGMLKRTRPRARYRRVVDALSLRLAQRVLVDSSAQAEFFESEFGGVREKVRIIHVGAPEWQFWPTPLPPWNTAPLRVLFYGYFAPLHGVDYIIRTAQRLKRDPRFRFVIVGSGQLSAQVMAMYRADPSCNIEFRPPTRPDEINMLIASCHICLGVFGIPPVTQRIVANKVWQCMAAGRPVITAGGPGPTSVFEDGYHCLLVPPADPGAIAAALDRLARDRRLAERLAANGAKLVRDRYTSEPLGRQLLDVLEEVVRPHP